MPKFRTLAQNSKMFGLASKCGLSHEDLRDYAADVSGGRTERTSKLYIAEADEIIHRLESALKPKEQSPRTIRYHRQKAGVVQLASAAPKHLKLMNDLAAKRNIGEQGLKNLCLRTIGKERPATTAETNKIIEALKDMAKRDRIFGAFKKEAA